MRKYFKLFGGLGAFAIVAGLAIGAYAFTNSITVSGSGPSNSVIAGYGQQSAPQLTASNIHFVVDATNPANFTSVSFVLKDGSTPVDNTNIASPGVVEVGYDSTATDVLTCTYDSENSVWGCGAAGGSQALTSVTAFNVTAAQ